jgi:hypothetical protein
MAMMAGTAYEGGHQSALKDTFAISGVHLRAVRHDVPRAGTCLQPRLENVKRERRYQADDTCRRTCGEWRPRAVQQSVAYYFVQNRVWMMVRRVYRREET